MLRELILIVEDDTPIAENLTEFLKIFGYRSARASTGMAALDLIRDLNPDLILVDIRMEEKLAGVKLVKQLRKEFNETPVIFITADVTEATQQLTKGLGTTLNKPFGMNQLMQAIKDVLDD